MDIQELFRAMINQSSVKTIYGEPIVAASKTVIPVAAIRYGFGGGSGQKSGGQEHGGGGGDGFVGRPVRVVEITLEQTRFVPITSSTWTLVAAVGVGLALGVLIAQKKVDVRVEKERR